MPADRGEYVQVTMTWRVPVESTGMDWITEAAAKARDLRVTDALTVELVYSGSRGSEDAR